MEDHPDPLDLASPNNFDDDGDVSNVAVGASSPTYDRRSPMDVSHPPGHSATQTSSDNGPVESASAPRSGGADRTGSLYRSAFPSVNDDEYRRTHHQHTVSGETTSASESGPALLLPGVSAVAVEGSPVPSTAGARTSTTAVPGAASSASNFAVASSAPHSPGEPSLSSLHHPPEPLQVLHTLALNKKNLATFEDSVQRGAVPLRTDVIDDRNFITPRMDASNKRRPAATGDEAANTHAETRGNVGGLGVGEASVNDLDRSESTVTNYPARSAREGSIITQTEHDMFGAVATPFSAMGGQTAESASPMGRDDTSRLTLAERYSLASVESTVGSAAARPADPLSKENLQLHLQELTSGVPVPLNSENIGPVLPKSSTLHAQVLPAHHTDSGDEGAGETSNARSHGDADATLPLLDTPASPGAMVRREESLVVEASEAAPSEFASTVDTAMLRATLRTAANSEGALEELWSTTSTHDADGKSQASWAPSTEALQSLSKKSLRQLRRQLESGETPLRPEVLAGLSNVAKAMNIRSEPSPSMVVEVPRDETRRGDGTREDSVGLRRGMVGGGRGDSAGVEDDTDDIDEEEDAGSSSIQFKSPANAPVDATASDAGGMSFHSTVVEVPNRGRVRPVTVAGGVLGSAGPHGEGTAMRVSGGAVGRRGVNDPINRSANTLDTIGFAGSVSNNGASVRASPLTGASVRSAAVGILPFGSANTGLASRLRDTGSGGASGSNASAHGSTGVGRVIAGSGTGASHGRHLDVSADLSTNNVDLFGDDEDDDQDMHDDDVDKSTTALSQDDDEDDEGHHEESVFMTEDGTEPHDDIAFLKRCLAEVMQTLKETRHDQAQLSRQLQSIKDELSTAQGSGRGVDFSDRNSERSLSNYSPNPRTAAGAPTLAAAAGPDSVNTHITSLRADMDEVRFCMREMQRAQIDLIERIERLQGVHVKDGGSETETTAPGTPPQPLQRTLPPTEATATSGTAAVQRRVRLVVECDTALLQGNGSAVGGPESAIRFLMPMPAEATVRQCKKEFLHRLAEQNPTLAAAGGLTAENTYIEMEGHTLFDSLVLGSDLEASSTSPHGSSYTLVLRKSRESPFRHSPML